jgi:predicted DsbA family dithiol-disulfide isomerase
LAWLAERYRTDLDGAREIAERPATMGRPDGIEIDVEKQKRANSFDAHRLVALGLSQGGPALQAAVLERLFSAHFSEGRQVDDVETLQRLGGEAGLDGRRLAAVLAGDEFADHVRADERAATEIGISGVPFFMANRKVALSGAHTTEVIGQLIEAATDGHPEAMSQGA